MKNTAHMPRAEKRLLIIATLMEIAREFERRGLKKKANRVWKDVEDMDPLKVAVAADRLAKRKPFSCSECFRRFRTVEATLIHKLNCKAVLSQKKERP